MKGEDKGVEGTLAGRRGVGGRGVGVINPRRIKIRKEKKEKIIKTKRKMDSAQLFSLLKVIKRFWKR